MELEDRTLSPCGYLRVVCELGQLAEFRTSDLAGSMPNPVSNVKMTRSAIPYVVFSSGPPQHRQLASQVPMKDE